MIELLTSPEAWVSLLTLTALEIVLGIDNIVFLAILAGRLPEEERARARRWGLAGALLGRLGLLFSIAWVIRLTEPLFVLPVVAEEISGRDLILLGGGLFLLWKSTAEIFHHVEGEEEHERGAGAGRASFASVVVQILLLDIVFSLDSVITAVGMVEHIEIMVAAVIIAVGIMLVWAGRIAGFIERHPSLKLLALSFLVLVGALLVAESFDHHVPKGYVYFAMAYALGFELLNIRRRAKQKAAAPVHLRPGAMQP